MLDRIMTEGHTKLSYDELKSAARQTEMASSLPGPANSGRELRRLKPINFRAVREIFYSQKKTSGSSGIRTRDLLLTRQAL